ncbi:TPA: hypothetical protein N0F65_007596 [Lagenidium giganteum]|uniref:MULE transposase domain-containing protein n=1 Tax=Lagenidium giganteum TaxID=4803 RepID=A0AAV2ZNL9_9STRA|nr:TPA: hypothetical protein N0F65_007596 [Lagenidium giganteum]
MIDKDFTEMAAIESAFEGILVLLCHWHVIKYWQKELNNARKYKFNAWMRSQILYICKSMMRAPTEDVFEATRKCMAPLVGSHESSTRWLEYFEVKWIACKEKWAAHVCDHIPILGNNTNNRLESSWQKLKKHVTR